jgi:acyl-CoA synthetase (AMP-forming)/AMP-acid ligase II
MGLIGSLLQPMYLGIPCVFMPPHAFLQQPVRWLRAISTYRATTSGAPNFAYELCVKRIGSRDSEGMDLSSWRVAFNGAEPVRAETIDRFSTRFAEIGFQRKAFFPCYGLAEASLIVSGGGAARPRVLWFDRVALTGGQARRVDASADAVSLVGCGMPMLETEVIIVSDRHDRSCEAGELGEIWVASPSVASGYFEQVEVSNEVFGQRRDGQPHAYLRTGDIGFLWEGELFVTGRVKDLMIFDGRNCHAEDIERTVDEMDPRLGIRGCAAFSIERSGEEQLVLLVEIGTTVDTDGTILKAIRQVVSEQHGLRVAEARFVAARSIPRTTSGKVRRSLCKANWDQGEKRE